MIMLLSAGDPPCTMGKSSFSWIRAGSDNNLSHSSEGGRNRPEYSQKYLHERTTELACLTRHFVQSVSPSWVSPLCNPSGT